ncbi:MAG: cache domain-containing protein [Bacteroidales bacterium]|jgi:PAS domain S-box-containing protein|nr:cache domain-containing protein [Bacteroidales bacterium]
MKNNNSFLKYISSLSGKNRKLVNVLVIETYIVIVILFFLLGYFSIYQKYTAFKKESIKLQQEFIEKKKQSIKKETLNAIDFINYNRINTEQNLKDLLRNRTNEAISMAQNIYTEYKNKKSAGEIQKIIIDALRPIRFNNGRGYYFIGSLNGSEYLFPIKTDYEGKNLVNLQDDMGNYVIRDEILTVKTYDEGFCYGYWKKPGLSDNTYQKISFVKLFAPYNWYIGTGEYIDDFTKDVQRTVLERVSKIRFEKEGYIFINTYDGNALITDGNLILENKNLWELEDPNGVKVIQEERNAAKNPEGDFIYYSWRKLTSSEIANKISFVKGIPEWQWMVGAGVYTDEIETTLAEHKKALYKSIKSDIIIILIVLIIIFSAFTVFSVYISKKATSSIDSFLRFFKKAAHDYILIDENRVYFSEFKSLASSANGMIREMKKTQLLKMEEELYFEGLFESAPEAIVLVGNNNHVIRVNKEFTRLFGFTKSEIHHKDVDDFIVPEELKAEAKENALRTEKGSNVSVETMRVCKDGRKIFVSILATPIMNTAGKLGTYIIYHDITNQKLIEQSLNEAKLKAEESDRLKTAFLTNMSHEIRTPMNAIIGFSTLVKNQNLSEQDKAEYLNIIEKSANNLLTIIDDIIDVSKLEAEQLSINKINTNINTIIDDLLVGFEALKKSKEIKGLRFIAKKGVPDKDFIVNTDPKRFKQIFTHLLDNALKFTEKGKIEFGYYIQDSNIICYVKDTGIGIPQEKMDSVVKPFRQADETDTRKYGGTGLGLSISKKLVENLGGKLWFESETGIGTTFYFSLSKDQTIKQQGSEEQNRPDLQFSDWQNKKILIAEDAETNFRFLEAVLEKTNVTVNWAKDGKEAIDLLEQNNDYDLILMDIQMPVLNGNEALKLIKSKGIKTPVIAQTAFAMESDRQEIISLGYDDYLIKPIEISLLLKKISEVFENKAAE